MIDDNRGHVTPQLRIPVSIESPYTPEDFQALDLIPERIPKHVAIIMDGNGRWAQSRGLPRIEGHRRGVDSVRTVVEECARMGLEQVTLYCFSSENWKRPRPELDLLMSLLQRFVVAERDEIMRQDIRFSTIGRKDRIGGRILKEVNKTIEMSCNNPGMRLCLALDYGARDEMVQAVKAISEKVKSGAFEPDQIDEQTISDHLYTAGMGDPDLVIRTAGEMRVSNFLLWQISYAELWVTEKCWPDFRQSELFEAFRDFGGRERRFGGLIQK